MSKVEAPTHDWLVHGVGFHYGWIILAGGAIGSFMTLPGQTNGVSLFFDSIAADLGLSRGQIALAYTFGTLAGALPAPFVGRWIDRRGPRLAAATIAIAMGLACAVMALTWSAVTVAIGFAALRGATIGGLSLVSQHVINLWFVARRGLAATAASIGVALGGVVFPQVIEGLIRTGGWRHAYLSLGVLVAGTMLTVGLLLFRDRPERFGLSPDLGASTQRSGVRPEPAFTRAEALRTAVFSTLSLANVLTNALGTGLLLNHFDLLSRAGVAREAAVIVFAPLAITQVIAAIGIGPLVDRFVPHRLVVLPMAGMAFACLLVMMVASTSGALRVRDRAWLRLWFVPGHQRRRLCPLFRTPTCGRDSWRDVCHHNLLSSARPTTVRLGIGTGELFPNSRWRSCSVFASGGRQLSRTRSAGALWLTTAAREFTTREPSSARLTG